MDNTRRKLLKGIGGALVYALAPNSAKASEYGTITITREDKVVSLGGIESEWAASITLPNKDIQLYHTPANLKKIVDLDGDGKLRGLEKELAWLVSRTASSVGGIPESIVFSVGGRDYNLMTMEGLKALDKFDDGYFIGIKDDVGFSTKFKVDPDLLNSLGLNEIGKESGGDGGDGGDGGGSASGSGSAGGSGAGAGGSGL